MLDTAMHFHLPTFIKGLQECERNHDTMRRVFNAMIEMHPESFCEAYTIGSASVAWPDTPSIGAVRGKIREIDRDQHESIMHLCRVAGKIEAIKELRRVTGMGLLESKHIVEAWWADPSLNR